MATVGAVISAPVLGAVILEHDKRSAKRGNMKFERPIGQARSNMICEC
jgi:hypothetical protein